MNTNKDQYTPWLIRTMSTEGSDYDVKTNGIPFFPVSEPQLQMRRRRLKPGDATLGTGEDESQMQQSR